MGNVAAGAPFWGHVVSKDLAHWTWLPPALLPDSEYDFNGVWSGAATVADDKPVLTYTGNDHNLLMPSCIGVLVSLSGLLPCGSTQ